MLQFVLSAFIRSKEDHKLGIQTVNDGHWHAYPLSLRHSFFFVWKWLLNESDDTGRRTCVKVLFSVFNFFCCFPLIFENARARWRASDVIAERRFSNLFHFELKDADTFRTISFAIEQIWTSSFDDDGFMTSTSAFIFSCVCVCSVSLTYMHVRDPVTSLGWQTVFLFAKLNVCVAWIYEIAENLTESRFEEISSKIIFCKILINFWMIRFNFYFVV